MKQIIIFIIYAVLLSKYAYPQDVLIKGADVSSLEQIENNSGFFTDGGIKKDALQIFKEHGVNYFRLRLWYNPDSNYNNLSSVLKMAERIKKAGASWLLDIHYSDTWADPSKQTKPALWRNLSFKELYDSVYAYTRNTLTVFKNAGCLPGIVQIGNEISSGFLWNDGRVGGEYETPAQWEQLAILLNHGLLAVKEFNASGENIKTMIHIDKGGDTAACNWFFGALARYNMRFDYIGLSYYPWWQGDLKALQENLKMLSERYSNKIILVETAYPWTLGWNDNTRNIIGNANQLLPGYNASVDGQTAFLKSLMDILKSLRLGKGLGFFYWEPDLISTPTFGSPWENLALFDFNWEVLNSIHAFESPLSVKNIHSQTEATPQLQNYPNPFNSSTVFTFTIKKRGEITLSIYNQLGKKVADLLHGEKEPGPYNISWQAGDIATGIYFAVLSDGLSVMTRKFILLK